MAEGPSSHTWTSSTSYPRGDSRSSGFRFICGDFNGDHSKLPELDDWVHAGWMEVQDLQFSLSGEGPYPTCKGSTRPDRIFIFPELAAHFVRCEVQDLFSDHSVVAGYFDVPQTAATYSWWPMPAKIPWGSVNLTDWQSSGLVFPDFVTSGVSSTQYLSSLGQHYEQHLGPFFEPAPQAGLPCASLGRAQTFHPTNRPQNLRCLRASRPGEEQPRCDLVSHSVQRWFRQLRRLQSLAHNLRRASDAPTAVCYRLELWNSIKTARGFAGTFPCWWEVRPHKLPGAPRCLPDLLPSLAVLEIIFEDFRCNYRALVLEPEAAQDHLASSHAD